MDIKEARKLVHATKEELSSLLSENDGFLSFVHQSRIGSAHEALSELREEMARETPVPMRISDSNDYLFDVISSDKEGISQNGFSGIFILLQSVRDLTVTMFHLKFHNPPESDRSGYINDWNARANSGIEKFRSMPTESDPASALTA